MGQGLAKSISHRLRKAGSGLQIRAVRFEAEMVVGKVSYAVRIGANVVLKIKVDRIELTPRPTSDRTAEHDGPEFCADGDASDST